MADKLTQLRSLYSKMPDGDAKKAVATKIAKLEASQPKEVVEVKEEVKETITKPKATKSASGKDKRHVFEKQVEGGKEVKVVMASSADLAKEAMQESGFEFVKTITRGRSPKEGFIPSGKVKKTKGTKRASKATRDDMAKEAGMTPEKAEKVSEKVAKAKKRGRKPMDKQAYLFEMPLKTQAGKVKRKVVTATSEASAQKSAGKNYTLVKELKAGENPKVGVQAVEGFVAPEPKKRGRKPKAKTLEEVTEKSEAIGEGIAIADKLHDANLDEILSELLTSQREMKEAMGGVSLAITKLQEFVKFDGKGKKMAHGGKTQGYDDKLDESLGSRKGAERTKEQSRKDRRDESAAMEKSMGRRKYASVGTMDKGRRSMEKGGLAIHFDEDYSNKAEIEDLLMYKTYMRDNEYLTDYGDSFYVYSDDISPSGVRDLYESIIEAGYDENVELEFFGKGGKTQGYDDKLDESLGSRKGAERTKEQSRKDRRDESAAMEKSMGRRKYSSVGTMDIEDRML